MMHIQRIHDSVLVVNGSVPAIKYTARICTTGAEYDMVQAFLRDIELRMSKQKGCKTAVFIEPQLDSGYPDIVIIKYSLEGIQQRMPERALLNNTYLKVLCEIDKRRKVSLSRLALVLGFDMQELTGIISVLNKAGIVRCVAKSVSRMPYRNYFCIKKIIAIEAKIDKWNVAIDQAVHNTRYADESYVLMKRDRCSPEIENRCKELGIGVLLMNGELHRVIKASREKHAKPYITFLFNEWIQQIEELEE